MSVGETVATRFPTLARHWQVLRESWAVETADSRSRKSHSDPEFLPAALEIMEKPPSPGLRWLLLSLCALFTIAILWSILGKVDVVVVATGKTLPVANIKIIQPIEIGSVRAIHVKNGQHVRKGQLLVELDSTLAGADRMQEGNKLMTAEVNEARGRAILAYLSGKSAKFLAPANAPPPMVAAQERMIQASIGEYEAERASLAQSRAERGADLASAQAEIEKLRQTLPLVEQQLEARRQLSERGYFSKLKLLEYEQLRVEHIQNIRVHEANAARAHAAMANLDAQIVKLRESLAKSTATDFATAQDESSVRTEDVRKTERRLQFQAIRSPVDGTVQQLAINTVGGIVQPAQALMVVVPDGSEIEVEAQIQNKDIGFVREGQDVRVKLEAYPFTEYGLIDGVIQTISRDAVEMPQQANPNQKDERGTRSASGGLVYAARIRLSRNAIRIAGRDQLIAPGLAVQAEIKTGERRIIAYLLSPIARSLDEAGRER